MMLGFLSILPSFGWSPRAQGLSRPRVGVGESWPLGRIAFSLLPLAGSDRRRTIEQVVVPGSIWTHDQIQGLLHVIVPVRQTVVKLSEEAGGGLLVHNPVAPTGELLQLMRVLEAEHGKVRHIVLGSLGLEHKALAGPFARQYPQATVWLQPGQWSFPLDLPPQLLGFPLGPRLRTIRPADDPAAEPPPWAADFDYEVLGPLRFRAFGAFGETAFVHRRTATLLVTDAVIRVDDAPSAIIEEDPRALMYHARNDLSEQVDNSTAVLRRGWRRVAIFALCFFPSAIEVRLRQLVDDRRRLPASMESLAEGAVPFGVMPWRWAADERPSFRALQGGLLVPPVLQELILNRFPEETLAWVRRVCQLRFSRIIPCHFANDLRAGPREFRRAFAFLERSRPPGPQALTADSEVLRAASDTCTRLGITQAAAAVPHRASVASVRPGRVGPMAMSCASDGAEAEPLPELAGGEEDTRDGLYSVVMISLFRLAFGRAVGWQSSISWRGGTASYEGLVDIARHLYRGLPSPEERNARIAAIFDAFPQRPQLLRGNRLSCELLGELTSRLFPFLVGRCRTERWDRPDGEAWRSKVVIERCRFLEASACKGMCVGLCKEPSEAYFASIGLPVSFTPNFEDGSCEMVWGRTPLQDDLADADLACFRTCSLAREGLGRRHTPLGEPRPAETVEATAVTATIQGSEAAE